MKYIYISFLILLQIQAFSQNEMVGVEVKLSNNQIIKGTYAIYYKKEENPLHKITKPFIICEGFDIGNNIIPDDIYEKNQFKYLIEPLRSRGYDVLILNLETNPIEIEKNAALFAQLIKEINAILVMNNSYHRITTMGISMGGLVTKMALAQMEHDGVDHRVERYISFDSPHQGANIPLGYQHMMDLYINPIVDMVEYWAALDKLNLNPFNYVNNGSINENKNYLIQTAALEMSAVFLEQNSWRQNFLQQLIKIDEFPQNCRKIAVSNGVIAENQGFESGSKQFEWLLGRAIIDQTLDWPEDISEMASKAGINLNPYPIKFIPISWENQVNAMPGDLNRRVFHAGATIQMAPNAPYQEVLHYNRYSYQRDYLTTPLDVNIDHVPGGYYSLNFLKDIESWANGIDIITIPINWEKEIKISDIPLVGEIRYTFSINKNLTLPLSAYLGEVNSNPGNPNYRFCFVPITSSLSLAGDYFCNVSNIEGYPYIHNKNITPFDAIYAIPKNESKNTLHAHLEYNGQAEFLLSEIAPANLYVQNQTFENGYTNTFEAQNIFVGNDVEPNSKKTYSGNVYLNSDSHIEFHIPENGSIHLKPGFKTNGGTCITVKVQNLDFQDVVFDIKPDYLNEYMDDWLLKSEVSRSEVSKNQNTKNAINDTIIPPVEIKLKTTILGMNDKEYISNNIPSNEINLELKTYPNPVTNIMYLNIKTVGQGNLNITFQNIQGKIIKKIADCDIKVDQSIYFNNIDISDLEKGLYMLNVKFGNKETTQKIIVQ